MMNNRSMPVSTIIPVLGYADVQEAAAWLERCFGFEERLRIGKHRAQLRYGNGDIAIYQHALERGTVALAHAVMVRVLDVDAHFAHAEAAGATILEPPTTHAYGERQYVAQDLGGHEWTFSQTVADVDPSSWGGQMVESSG